MSRTYSPSLVLLLLGALLISFALACGDGDPGTDPDADPTTADEDGDTIADADEGARDRVDTDGDGRPDFVDTDADDDGIEDAIEAGDDDLATPPVDSDLDGTPDFRDEDSDDNGMPDGVEGTGDFDMDGILDFADTDDDDDRVSDADELGDRVEFPADADMDGMPDFRDPDSDEDGILDGHEWGVDSDGDGDEDAFDQDSDGDGIPDSVEAGDSDLATAPVDTDGDGTPDFRDYDSDGDGLPDAIEADHGSDPTLADTDGDSVGDLIEVGAETDPADPDDNPQARGDFVFVTPYREMAMPRRDTLSFRTNIQFADLYFLFDTTGSMSGEISALKTASESIISNLTCTDAGTTCLGDGMCGDGEVCSAEGRCVEDPRISGCIASLWTGVGTYEGLVDSYSNLLSLQPLATETQMRIPGSASGGGGAESLFESVACVADPSVCTATCEATGVGCPGYRSDAVRILVTITDENNQCTTCSANTAVEAGSRLESAGIVFVGIDADARRTPETDLKGIARAADSYASTGEPLYFLGDEATVSRAVTTAVQEITNNRPVYVDIEAVDLPDDDGDALTLIDRLEVNVSGSGDCTAVASTFDTNGDSYDDAFPSLLPGTPVCWDIVARDNERIAATDRPQILEAEIVVRGDGSILDTRRVYFLIPPVIGPPILE